MLPKTTFVTLILIRIAITSTIRPLALRDLRSQLYHLMLIFLVFLILALSAGARVMDLPLVLTVSIIKFTSSAHKQEAFFTVSLVESGMNVKCPVPGKLLVFVFLP